MAVSHDRVSFEGARLTKPLVLALDLDETFAASDEKSRTLLFSLLEAHADDVKLVYMSHASAEKLITLAAEAELPVPEVFMADSGTTVLKGDGTGTIEPLQRSIIQLWPGKDAVQRTLKDIGNIELIEDQAPCRQAIRVTDPAVLEVLGQRMGEIGCHFEPRGDNEYHVLPYGVDKGTTLGRFLVEKNIDPENVIAFGEDVGDDCLFGRGWRGAVFGHSAAAVREMGARFHNVVVLDLDGAPGVLEALYQHGWLEVKRG